MKTEILKQDKESTLESIIRSLRHRNFRLFFSGKSISLIGTWMWRIAPGWLVCRITRSAFLPGLVGFAGQIPTFSLASFAGVLADRHNRHRILILTQTLAMIQAFVLSFLVLFSDQFHQLYGGNRLIAFDEDRAKESQAAQFKSLAGT